MAEHDQIQPARAVTLILIGAVADFTESIEEHRSAKRILLFTLVEPRATVATAQKKNANRFVLATPTNDVMATQICRPSMDGSGLDFEPLSLGCRRLMAHAEIKCHIERRKMLK